MSKKLKSGLILQCKETVGNDLDGRRPLNIAVIGTPGCGKSSFLNTIFASFKDNDKAHWSEIAKVGDYGVQDIQETSRFRIYSKQHYMGNNINRVLMPTFLDMTGFDDEDTEINKEILSIVFEGKLQVREDLSNIRNFYLNNGENIQKLRQLYNKKPVKARVDRIIVVCTANRRLNLPVALLKAIRITAKRGSREIPVYGVLTYADKEQLNDGQYIERQTLFRMHLGLIKTRFKCIANYCTDVDPTGLFTATTLPELDIPVLELMTQVLFPHPDDTPTPDKTISMKKIAFAFAIFIILLAIVLKIVL